MASDIVPIYIRTPIEVSDETGVLCQVLDDEDIPAEQLRPTLDELQGDLRERALAIGKAIRAIRLSLGLTQGERKRLEKREEVLQSKLKETSEYLFYLLETAGVRRVADLYCTVTVKKNPPHVVVDDPDRVPSEYRTTEVVHGIDKMRIRDALKAGEEVNGCRLGQGKRVDVS